MSRLIIALILILLLCIGLMYDFYRYEGYRRLVKEIESGKREIIVDYPVTFKESITIPPNTTIIFTSPDLIKSK